MGLFSRFFPRRSSEVREVRSPRFSAQDINNAFGRAQQALRHEDAQKRLEAGLCPCRTCWPMDFSDVHSVFDRGCPVCGETDCPKTDRHTARCTGKPMQRKVRTTPRISGEKINEMWGKVRRDHRIKEARRQLSAGQCPCHACWPENYLDVSTLDRGCPDCGNMDCPKTESHTNRCSSPR